MDNGPIHQRPAARLHGRQPASPQGRFWIGTIGTASGWLVPTLDQLPPNVVWLRGQKELGAQGFEHYQVCIAYSRAVRRSVVTSAFPGHWELTRSDAAREYVWKEDTRVPGSQFEIGSLALRRSSKTDWDSVRSLAVSGDLQDVPSDVYVRCYNQLRRIGLDHMQPVALERTCHVFWGSTGTGKSRRAWDEAGLQAYAKVF